MDRRQLSLRIAFSQLRGINQMLALEILARIGSEEAFFEATDRQLAAVMGFSNRIFDRQYRDGLLKAAEVEADFTEAGHVDATYFTDADYPSRLHDCTDAPLMLYSTGSCRLNDVLTVGVVGTRHATPYGVDFCRRLVEGLASRVGAPVAVVSGLAYGIDVAAHRAAIECGLPTVAVLAHGLNTIYPAAHRNTAVEMVRSGGLLLTDYMSSAAVHKGNFLARNRIVAGISDCLVVVESAEKGGAMVTARIASDYDRDVFALPGRTSDIYSAGCNSLIRRNVASLVGSADDLIDAMRWPRRQQETAQSTLFPEISGEEQSVMDYLRERGEAQINRLSVDLDIPVGRLTGMLIEMEFKGLVLPYPGAKYRPA